MEKEKNVDDTTIINWRRLLITILIVLLTAGVIGGIVWFVMDQNERDSKATTDARISSLQEKIDSLQVTETPSVSTTPAPTPTKDVIAELKSFCQANGSSSSGTISYMETANGAFGNCSFENAMMITTNTSGSWTKIWSGNGVIDNSVCDQYKIPNKMSGGTCNY